MSNILVTGATGNTCSILIPALLNAGHSVRALVRNEVKAQGLEEAGAELFVGDLDNIATLQGAFDGIDTVYLCLWNGPTAETQGMNVIEAIKRSGMNPFVVRHSAYGSPDSRIIQQIIATDDLLKASGLRWTSIKPTFFMQNIMMAAPSIQNAGQIYWDWADGKAGMLDIRDVADSAFGALTGKAEEGKEYILTGPAPVSFHEIAEVFTRILDKDVTYIPVPHVAAKDAMMGMGFPEFIVDGYIELNEGFASGYADLTTPHVGTLSGHAPRSIEDFVRDFQGYFQPELAEVNEAD